MHNRLWMLLYKVKEQVMYRIWWTAKLQRWKSAWLAAVRLTSDLVGKLCSSMADQQFSCSTCSKQFTSRWGLLRHRKKEHGVESEGRMRCQEENCEFSCHYVRQLRSHLSKNHSIEMDSELKEFSSEEGLSQHISSYKPGSRCTDTHTHAHTITTIAESLSTSVVR